MTRTEVVLAAVLILGLVDSSSAQEWSRFRGPNGTGLAPANDSLPSSWTEKDLNWKVKLPGVGHSSPVVWGDRIFLTSGEKTGKRLVLCLSTTDGKTLWSREFEGKPSRMHRRNSVGSSTPAVDAQRVYAAFGGPDDYTVLAFNHDGNELWKVDLGPFQGQHGFGISPSVYEDLLIVPNEQDGGGSLMALECATGKIRWKTPRQGKNATYSTPCVFQPKGAAAQLIFTNWQHGITAVDPKTGKVNWEISVFNTQTQERAIGSPVAAGDLVIGSCGFAGGQKHVVAVKPGAATVKPQEAWRLEKGAAHMPTPLVKDGLTFVWADDGQVTCLRTVNGAIVWQERVPGKFTASPVCVGDRLFGVADDGRVTVLSATEKYAVLGRSELGEPTQSTPAVSAGRMFFRTESHLMCLGK